MSPYSARLRMNSHLLNHVAGIMLHAGRCIGVIRILLSSRNPAAPKPSNGIMLCRAEPMNDEEFDLFRKEMADVKPLSAAVQAVVREASKTRTPGQTYRREAAQRSADEWDESRLPTAFVEPVRPEAIISFKRDGIQHGVFRRLQKGAYDIEAMLDLHGLTVEQARHEVHRFIGDCRRYDVRLALISHGKGRRNKDQIPLLKSFLVRWLPMFPEVMAYHSAQKWHGGAGAVYVLLRKSEKAKAETRERLGLSSGKPVP